MEYYLHEVPGRLRVKAPHLKADLARARRVERSLTRLVGVTSASFKPITGSLVVKFDPARASADLILNTVFQDNHRELIHAMRKNGKPGIVSNLASAVFDAVIGTLLEKALAAVFVAATANSLSAASLWTLAGTSSARPREWLVKILGRAFTG